MVKISNRLAAVAALVSEGNILADVGTDHGYIPIYLLEKKRIPKAIAMDINRGPLDRAKEHIRLFGMENYIETRRSDGVAALAPGEAETILIAGMGGGLVIHILEAGDTVCKHAKELVLQPQSEIERVRRYLAENGYETLQEDMVSEDGKFYPMMRVCCRNGETSENGAVPEVKKSGREQEESAAEQEEGELEALSRSYGGLLLKAKHPVLEEYLEKEQMQYQKIYESLMKKPHSQKLRKRISEVEEILRMNRKALAYYKK